MQPYQERIIAEKKELDERLVKLDQFIFVPNPFWESLPLDEKKRLKRQWAMMVAYSGILCERINAFDAKET